MFLFWLRIFLIIYCLSNAFSRRLLNDSQIHQSIREGVFFAEKKHHANHTRDCKLPAARCKSVKSLQEIYKKLHDVAQTHSDVAKLSVIGESFGGNPIYAMEIHSGTAFYYGIIVVDFGMDSREWASPASGLHLIEQLVNIRGKLIEHIQWFIIPMVNPDGYIYSTTVNNMWRKNRQPTNGTKCTGVNINKNFGVGWEKSLSADPCREDYSGSEPMSENETQAIMDFVEVIDPDVIDAYVSVHACLQSIFYPYEYTEEQPPPGILRGLEEVGHKMAAAMAQLRNSSFYVGANTEFFLGGGVVGDFMLGTYGIPLVFQLELGDIRHHAAKDFHQCYHPADRAAMEALTKECFLGLKALADHLIETRAPYRNRYRVETAQEKEALDATPSTAGELRGGFRPLLTLFALLVVGY